MIEITTNSTNINEAFIITGIVIPTIILVTLGLLVLLFSLVGIALVTLFIVTFTLAVVGISFSWPLVIAGLVLYWLFKQPNRQKVQD
jgi:cell division protein FtsW (lipid II flippase)